MNILISMLLQKAKKQYSKTEYLQIKEQSFALYRALCSENETLPKAMKTHTNYCIFPAIAVYKTLESHGMGRENAVDLISEFFSTLSGNGFKLFALWLHLFGNYHRYPKNFIKNSQKSFSPDSGFVYSIHHLEDTSKAQFDILKCPYHDMCIKYNCLELNRAFCDSDDAKYGKLHPNLKWLRTGTLGKGAPCCDFLIQDTTRLPK